MLDHALDTALLAQLKALPQLAALHGYIRSGGRRCSF